MHADGFDEPRARSINFFEDPFTHQPRDPTTFGRPYPQYLEVTRYETTAGSLDNGWQLGLQRPAGGTQLQFGFRVTY